MTLHGITDTRQPTAHITEKLQYLKTLHRANLYIWKSKLLFQMSVSQSVQSFSHVQLFATPWIAACQASTTVRISLQFSSVTQLCLTLYNPKNHSTPGLPVHHQLPELTQTHAHRVGDAHPAISSSVVPFSSCPQSLPASGFFQ